jgi:hypothetical protein
MRAKENWRQVVEMPATAASLSERRMVHRFNPCTGDPMKYMLMIYDNEADFEALAPAVRDQALAAYGAYSEALVKAGVLVEAERLRPVADATTVRMAKGKSEVLNGPYAETREQLGGFYLIDVPDLDTALSWASRCPGASHGTVEVRPVWAM